MSPNAAAKRNRHVLLVALSLSAMLWEAPLYAVVGYINVALTNGNNYLANELDASNAKTNNILTAVLPGEYPDGMLLFKFDPSTQYYTEGLTYLHGVGWYSSSGKTNDPTVTLNPGEGLVLQLPPSTNTNVVTFVGTLLQGLLTNPIPANYSLKGCMVPLTTGLQTSLGFPAQTNDVVWRGDPNAPAFATYAYSGKGTNWSPGEPQVNAAEGFFIHRDPSQATPAHDWVLNFVVGSPATQAPAAPSTSAPEITRMTIQSGLVTLDISNPGGGPYNVQFSTDGMAWTTVGTNQTGAVWSGPLSGGLRGYYQVVSP